MFGFGSRKEIKHLERKIAKLENENEELQKQLRKKKELFNPRWRKKMTVSPYIFEKYISRIGKPVIGGYHVRCEDETYYNVIVDKDMGDGYIRYEEAFEEPHEECKECSTTFKIILGYPESVPDFCSYECYKNFLNK